MPIASRICLMISMFFFLAGVPASADQEVPPPPAKGVAAGTEAEGLSTTFTLLSGHPDTTMDDSGTVLIVPGTVIPEFSEQGKWSTTVDLKDRLKDSYRLEGMKAYPQYMKHLPLDEPTEMPCTIPGISVFMTLVGYNSDMATYRVRLEDSGELLADTAVSVARGGRAVVGSQNGDLAPYLFLVIGAMGEEKVASEQPKIEKLKLIERINPEYPKECRKEQISGLVLLKLLVAEDGSAKVLEVLESPDSRLSDAAAAAAAQWRFEPPIDKNGKVVSVEYVVTVKFALK